MTDILSTAPQTEDKGTESSGFDYSGTASQAYRAMLAVVETVEPRIAGAWVVRYRHCLVAACINR